MLLRLWLEKVDTLYTSQNAQSNAIKAFDAWLADSKRKLQEFEKLSKMANKPIPNAEAKELKSLLEDDESWDHDLLEKAIASGKNLFAYITPRTGTRSEPTSER